MTLARYIDALKSIQGQGLTRELRALQSPQGREIQADGRRFLNFSSNNYLDLANDARVLAAMDAGARRYGVGAGSARLVNGNFEIAAELEAEIARFKGSEAALLFHSGYLANVGALNALLEEGDVVFSDALNHASMIDGLRLSRAHRVVYPHVDVAALRESLVAAQKSRRPGQTFLIATESVFSMDGDLAPIPELLKLAREFEALLYVDEAHATGVFGESGAGCCEALMEDAYFREHGVVMGTLGKALGVYGAYVAGSRVLVEYLLQKARTFIFTTGLPPGVVAAALEALRILGREPQRRESLWERIREMEQRLREFCPSWEGQISSAILPLPFGDVESVLAASHALQERGFWISAIRPPTVPTPRLRVTLMSSHTAEDVESLARALSEVW